MQIKIGVAVTVNVGKGFTIKDKVVLFEQPDAFNPVKV